MIFLTVGTQFGFDRLVRAVDEAIEEGLIQEEVFAQIGSGCYQPRRMTYVVGLEKELFDQKFQSAQAVISHAGVGNISMAIQAGKPLLVLPRLKRYDEVVNDHQLHTARKFEQSGNILVAYEPHELPEKIALLKDFTPKPRVPNRQGLVDRIVGYMNAAAGSGNLND